MFNEDLSCKILCMFNVIENRKLCLILYMVVWFVCGVMVCCVVSDDVDL